MTLVFAAAWLIPIVLLSSFIVFKYQKAYTEKSENLIQNAVNLSCMIMTTDIDTAISKVQKPTYEGEWENLFTQYERENISFTDYIVAMKASLISKYYMDEQFSRFAFYLADDINPCSYSGKNGYGYDSFLENVQPVVREIQAKDSNYIELHVIDNQIYLIRNLYTVNDYRKFATLVVGLDKNVLMGKIPLDNRDTMFITVDDSSLSTKNTLISDFTNDKWLHFVKKYTCDNYSLDLHYFEDRNVIYQDVNELMRLVIFIIFAMVPLIILSYIFLTAQIEKPLMALTEASQKMQEGELGTTVDKKMPNREFGDLSESFNAMSVQVKHLIDTVYLEQIAAKDALIDSLQAQINPHFLNNTLEMMNWQARMNGDIETSKMIESLGTVLDFSMNRNHNRLVRLSDELHCGDAFLYIMSMRFGQRLIVEKDISEDLYNKLVPSLILQPLLENAIKHGVEKVSQGTVWLKIYSDSVNLNIDVINTGKPMDDEQMVRIRAIIEGSYRLEKAEPGMHTSIGIYNVNQRIKLIFGEAYGLNVSLTEDGNFKSSIVVPLTEEGI